MTFEVGAVLEDAKSQAPVYCFEKKDAETDPKRYRADVGYLEFEPEERQGILRGSMLL